jgi:hypothetical protein
VYGVCLVDGESETGFDRAATVARRQAIREERRLESRPPAQAPRFIHDAQPVALHPHPVLDLVDTLDGERFRCVRCACDLGPRASNYKAYALRRDRDMHSLSGRPLPSGEPYMGVIREYACPGCATLLQVDVYCPQLGGEEDWWDIRV